MFEYDHYVVGMLVKYVLNNKFNLNHYSLRGEYFRWSDELETTAKQELTQLSRNNILDDKNNEILDRLELRIYL